MLTPKQARFVAEYLVDLNATQAAVRAGYSEKTAHTIGHENLRKPEIATAVHAGMAERARRTDLSADLVIQGLLREACFMGDGTSHGARVAAWERLGRHLGMFPTKVEHSGANGGPIRHDVRDVTQMTDAELEALAGDDD